MISDVDEWRKSSDQESMPMARRLLREEVKMNYFSASFMMFRVFSAEDLVVLPFIMLSKLQRQCQRELLWLQFYPIQSEIIWPSIWWTNGCGKENYSQHQSLSKMLLGTISLFPISNHQRFVFQMHLRRMHYAKSLSPNKIILSQRWLLLQKQRLVTLSKWWKLLVLLLLPSLVNVAVSLVNSTNPNVWKKSYPVNALTKHLSPNVLIRQSSTWPHALLLAKLLESFKTMITYSLLTMELINEQFIISIS